MVAGHRGSSSPRDSNRAEYLPPAKLPEPGSGAGAAVLPPEFKVFFFEFIQAVVIIASAGGTFGLVPLVLSDDFSKFFHQFALAHLQQWTCHLTMLDPATVSRGVLESLLSKASEAVLARLAEL